MKSDLRQLIEQNQKIVIIQADNPDGDSLGSALALEAILSELGKEVILYCGVDVPGYLRYMSGWDRVVSRLPHDFDMSVVVDTSSLLLLESLQKSGEINWLKTKPLIIIDHHSTEPTIDFASEQYIKPAVATGELIYNLTKDNGWPLPLDAGEHIVNAVMSDSLGLISDSTTADSVRVVADLMEKGVSLAKLDAKRREFQKKQREILEYKGKLLGRIQYSNNGEIAYITIPWAEIEKYSPLYNPPMLVLDEMRQVEGVKLAVAFKSYPDGRITAKLRSNYGWPVCADIAEVFGGGGHTYASGFRVENGTSLDEIINKTLELAEKVLKESKVKK